MHQHPLRTAVRPTTHPSFDRRSRPSDFVPGPRRDGYASFRDSIGGDLAKLMANDPAVASVQVRPETFTWRDGPGGRRQRYVPDLLAVMSDGSKVYRTVRPHALLLRDPDFTGRRARIELECLVRGGTFEVWTEREIREATCGCSFLRLATAAEADLFAATPRHPAGGTGNTPPFVLIVADRLGLGQPRRVCDAFLARSLLTGILMAVLCDPVVDPATGAEAWKPAPRRS